MNTILNAELPNLVVLNGDLITGENTFLENSTHYVDEIVAPLVQHGIPWASAYGNHDTEYNLSAQDLLERENRYPLSLTRSMIRGPNAGVSNYYLPVYSSDLTNPTLRLLLWFFDSRGGKAFQELDENGNEVFIPGNVDESVSLLVANLEPQLYGELPPNNIGRAMVCLYELCPPAALQPHYSLPRFRAHPCSRQLLVPA
jgi:hypothetical protein